MFYCAGRPRLLLRPRFYESRDEPRFERRLPCSTHFSEASSAVLVLRDYLQPFLCWGHPALFNFRPHDLSLVPWPSHESPGQVSLTMTMPQSLTMAILSALRLGEQPLPTVCRVSGDAWAEGSWLGPQNHKEEASCECRSVTSAYQRKGNCVLAKLIIGGGVSFRYSFFVCFYLV